MPEMEAVYEILKRRVEPRLLHGYFAGELDEEKGRLYGSTFVKISDIDFSDYSWWLSNISGGSFGSIGADDERSRIYLDDGCYTYKDRDTRVKEGILVSYSVRFYGARVDGEWYILKELTFYGDKISEQEARTFAGQGSQQRQQLQNPMFLPVEEHNSVIFKRSKLPAEDIEFTGLPWMVAHIKREEKHSICMAFTRYFNLEVFIPFKNRLIAEHYEELSEMYPYMSEYLLIFPRTKEFVLIPVLVRNQRNEYRLYYFFWHAERKKMYKWTYFTSAVYAFLFFYGELVLGDLGQISEWNEHDYLGSSCTMDDYDFWLKYVLVEENGRFKYLAEI